MLPVTKGRKSRPCKMILYGVEGIGKSTIASQAPDPLFIDTEGGSSLLDVKRVEPTTWAELMDFLDDVIRMPNVCKTLVLDTADWSEQLAVRDVCMAYKKTGIEDFGYGKGWTYVGERYTAMLGKLDAIVEKGMNVFVLAHAVMRKVELPDEAGSFDHWELKLSKQSAPKLKEWADALLFANYKTDVTVDEHGKGKATGGKRVIYTDHRPYWDAKNRFGWDECVALSYGSIKGAFLDEDVAIQEQAVTDDWEAFVKSKGFEVREANELLMLKCSKGMSREDAIESIKQNWDKAAEWLTNRRK